MSGLGRSVWMSALLAVVVGGSALAQTGTRPSLTAVERREALNAVEMVISEHYVFPERTAEIIARLDQAAALGRYDTADPAVFADRVSDDLLAATGDTHLYLRFEPDWFEASGQLIAADDGQRNAVEAQIARHTNHGLSEMRILPGNIRYLRIEGFPWIETESGAAYDAAMLFLRGGRAVILDLRGNGGGWIEASRYLISHFLPANTLIATFQTPGQTPEQYRTADYLASGRIQDVPIYVLIDGGSRSAAEMVAYTFEQYHLGELVGARTQGAANISDDFSVAPGFRLSVSTGRTIQAISQTDWEGVGVAPTVETDPADALIVAQIRAIDRLLPNTPDGVPRYQLAWARPQLEAELNPVTVETSALARLVGTYGPASIEMQGGSLWLHRSDRAPVRLQAMNADGLFQAVNNDGLRVRITSDGLALLRLDPAFSELYPKTAPAGR